MNLQNYSISIFMAVAILLLFINLNKKGTKFESVPLFTGLLIWSFVILSFYLLEIKKNSINNIDKYFLLSVPFLVFTVICIKIYTTLIRNKEHKYYLPEKKINYLTQEKQMVLKMNNICCSKYLTDNPKVKHKTKSGKVSKIGWYLLIANYYEWELYYSVEITDSIVKVIAISKGIYSSNFQLAESSYNVTINQEIKINCLYLNNICQAQSSSVNSIEYDGPFEAAVLLHVKDGKTPQQIIITCDVVSSLKGRLFIDDIKLKFENVSGTINRENKSVQHLMYNEDHEFICYNCGN